MRDDETAGVGTTVGHEEWGRGHKKVEKMLERTHDTPDEPGGRQ